MRVIVLTSNGLRHKYFLKVISENFDLVGAVYEDKGEYYKKQVEESAVVEEHFKRLSSTEEKFFQDEVKNLALNNVEIKNINKNQINDENIISWAKDLKPDIVFLFGTGILKDGWLDNFENKIINLHLGLSPFYRGSATLFWPFVNDELECVGATIHIAAKKVDAGDILHRVKPNIQINDNYYTINYKTIKSTIDKLPYIATQYINGYIDLKKQDISNSKVYKKSDFNESVLVDVLERYKDNIPKEILNKIKESDKCICCQ
ncbi:formyltransferase family protein [Malaciobacter sp. WC5094]